MTDAKAQARQGRTNPNPSYLLNPDLGLDSGLPTSTISDLPKYPLLAIFLQLSSFPSSLQHPSVP